MAISVNINGLRVTSVASPAGLRRALLDLSEQMHKELDMLIQLKIEYQNKLAAEGNVVVSTTIDHIVRVSDMIQITEDSIQYLINKGLKK